MPEFFNRLKERFLKLKKELQNIIDKELDFVTIIKFKNENQFLEEELGKKREDLFI